MARPRLDLDLLPERFLDEPPSAKVAHHPPKDFALRPFERRLCLELRLLEPRRPVRPFRVVEVHRGGDQGLVALGHAPAQAMRERAASRASIEPFLGFRHERPRLVDPLRLGVCVEACPECACDLDAPL